MFNKLKAAASSVKFARSASIDSIATTVETSDSEYVMPFNEFIQSNMDTWLNNVEELCFEYLTNKDKQREIILDRQSITYQQGNSLLKIKPKNLRDLEILCDFELETVFKDLASKYNTTQPEPRSDISNGFNFRPHGHPHDNLASKGFSEEELTDMSLADAIIYDAVIFSAQSWAGQLNDCTPYLSNREMAEEYKPFYVQACQKIEQKIIEKIRQYREIQRHHTTSNSEDSIRSSLTSTEAFSDTEQEVEQIESSLTVEVQQPKYDLEKTAANQKLAIEHIQSKHAAEIEQLKDAHVQELASMATSHQQTTDQLKLTHLAEIQHLNSSSSLEIERLKSNYDNKLQKAIAQHQLISQQQATNHVETIGTLQKENTKIRKLNAEHQSNLHSAQQAKKEVEANLKLITDVNEKLQTQISLLSVASTKTITTDPPENQQAIQCKDSLLSGLSYEIIGGFIAAIGISAVALAIAALSIASFGILPAAGIMVVGTLLATGGFFCLDKGAAQRVTETQYSLRHPF